MKKSLYFCILSIIIAGFRCTHESPVIPEKESVVVRAFIYAHEHVRDIQLTSSIPLGSETTTASPINNADVRLIKNGQTYQLESSPGDSGYYHYNGNDLVIETGDELFLDISYFGRHISGETVVPSSPKNITISRKELILPKIIEFGSGNFNPRSLFGELTVRWEKEADALYYVTIDNVESEPQDILIEMMFGTINLSDRAFTFISNPTARDSMRVNLRDISHLGKHRVKVYRINQEYADLYYSRNQDSRDLNEPLTNINNGLGVFSAFNSDSLFFYVKQE